MHFSNHIELETPESVELEFTLAGISNRAFALAIDYLILGFTLLMTLIIAVFSTAMIKYIFYSQVGEAQFLQWLWAIVTLVEFTIYVGYFVFFETIWQGQTPGKKIVKIRVIRDDGRAERLSQAVLRALLRPIDDILFIGILLIACAKKEKRIGDLVAGTVVIKVEQATKSANLLISKKAKYLAKKLKQETAINNLLPEDFATIGDYLQRRKMMTLRYQHKISNQLATQVKEIIFLENISERYSNYSNNQFLEAVYFTCQEQLITKY